MSNEHGSQYQRAKHSMLLPNTEQSSGIAFCLTSVHYVFAYLALKMRCIAAPGAHSNLCGAIRCLDVASSAVLHGRLLTCHVAQMMWNALFRAHCYLSTITSRSWTKAISRNVMTITPRGRMSTLIFNPDLRSSPQKKRGLVGGSLEIFNLA